MSVSQLGLSMRVKCSCGADAVISSSQANENNVAEQLCSCTDPLCGHTFVNGVAHKKTLKPSALHVGIGATFSNGRVQCGCGSVAVIEKTERHTHSCADLYCSCKNPQCGHRFVMASYYISTLSPSAKTTNEMAVSLARALTPENRAKLQQQLSMF